MKFYFFYKAGVSPRRQTSLERFSRNPHCSLSHEMVNLYLRSPIENASRLSLSMDTYDMTIKTYNALIYELARFYFFHHSDRINSNYDFVLNDRNDGLLVTFFMNSCFSNESFHQITFHYTMENCPRIINSYDCSCGRRAICHHVAACLMMLNRQLTINSIRNTLVVFGGHAFFDGFDETETFEDSDSDDWNSDSDMTTSTEEENSGEPTNLKRLSSSVIEKNRSHLDTQVGREIICQICLDLIEVPILMPCHSHSICLKCMIKYFKEKKESHHSSYAEINCPTCGSKSGIQTLKTLKHIKINKEMERIVTAYCEDMEKWRDEKKNLEKKIERLENEKLTRLNLKKEDEEENKEISSNKRNKIKIDVGEMEEILNASSNKNKKNEKSALKRKTRQDSKKESQEEEVEVVEEREEDGKRKLRKRRR